MSMEIGYHGGGCCGIKTIHSFSGSPESVYSKKPEGSKKNLDDDRICGFVSSVKLNLFWPARPKETGRERFRAMIEHIENVRHFGIVECVIAWNDDSGDVEPLSLLRGRTATALTSGEISSYEEAVEKGEDRGEYDSDHHQWYSQNEWAPVFEEHGFKLVSEAPNINSGNLIRVYHLVMNGEYYRNKEKKKEKQ